MFSSSIIQIKVPGIFAGPAKCSVKDDATKRLGSFLVTFVWIICLVKWCCCLCVVV